MAPQRKLTNRDVLIMSIMYKAHNYPIRMLATVFDVSYATARSELLKAGVELRRWGTNRGRNAVGADTAETIAQRLTVELDRADNPGL